VLFKTNSHDGGPGEALADKHSAKGLPHFILMDSTGAPLDRWRGFSDPARWLRTFDQAFADPTTVDAKRERFRTGPTEALAAALGRIQSSLGEAKESVAFYREAEKLAGRPVPDYSLAMLFQQARGMGDDGFTLEEVRASADAVMGSPDAAPVDKLLAADVMSDVAKEKKDPSLMTPYLQPALAASEGLADAKAKQLRGELAIAEALLIRGDKNLAVSLKREAMSAGWDGDAGKLNDFAWWCFENEVNLEEAERLARKGTELAKPGPEKAEILDTLAEIRNLRGDREEARALSELAAKEDPGSEHYPKQVERFSEPSSDSKPHAGA